MQTYNDNEEEGEINYQPPTDINEWHSYNNQSMENTNVCTGKSSQQTVMETYLNDQQNIQRLYLINPEMDNEIQTSQTIEHSQT